MTHVTLAIAALLAGAPLAAVWSWARPFPGRVWIDLAGTWRLRPTSSPKWTRRRPMVLERTAGGPAAGAIVLRRASGARLTGVVREAGYDRDEFDGVLAWRPFSRRLPRSWRAIAYTVTGVCVQDGGVTWIELQSAPPDDWAH